MVTLRMYVFTVSTRYEIGRSLNDRANLADR
jgi:hypothetical protein